MTREEIKLLYEYNRWANARILRAASSVTAEQFLAPASFPHGGLRSTLTHMLTAEWLWRKRWEGHPPTSLISPEEFPAFESLRARWLDEEKSLMTFVEKLTDGRLNSEVEYNDTKGRPWRNILWQMMVHTVNHGTQHRSEAAAMLTDLGYSPGDLDLILFLRER